MTQRTEKIDSLVKDVARMVASSGNGSTSNIQRISEIGYNRAENIAKQLEEIGVLSLPAGPGMKRDVLVRTEADLEWVFRAFEGRQKTESGTTGSIEKQMESILGGDGQDRAEEELDSLVKDIARMVVREGNGSTSNIQKVFDIGYNRAGKITDQLERMGVVSPPTGARKDRNVLVQTETELERIFRAFGL